MVGKYKKLLNRFFEPLMLSMVLGQVRGDRPLQLPRSVYRQFLDDLALLCEFEKGGDACTAIGCEDRPEATVFWVAANTNASGKIVPFLRAVLHDLKAISPLLGDDAETAERTAMLIDRCTKFAAPKIKSLTRLLERHLETCVARLEVFDSPADTSLATWLHTILGWPKDPDVFCRLAHESRHSSYMERMRQLDEESVRADPATGRGMRSPFGQARHYIGRLCQFVSAPQRLVGALSSATLSDLVGDEFTVRPITPLKCVPRPLSDDLSLDAICSRMLPKNSSELPLVKEALHEMDRKHGILQTMKKHYTSPTFKPRVHAEVQMLETFYEGNLQWTHGDKYIGCSKPACLCCKLYLRYHPSHPSEPDSHEKVYKNWGPVWLPGGVKDSRYAHQRDILNEMVKHFRQDALEQLKNLGGPRRYHADSRTGITSDGPVDTDGRLHEDTALGIGEASDFSDMDSDGGTLL